MLNKWLAAFWLWTFCALAAAVQAASADIRIDDNQVFPENLSSANGAVYVGSSTKGIVYRAEPGSHYAEPWIAAQPDYPRVFGVLTDAASNTLWICYNGQGKAMLKSFNLKSGAAKNSYDFSGGGLCNDIAVKNGVTYATDTQHGRILKLARGASALADWYSQPGDPTLCGIVWAKDGKLYAGTFGSGHFIRINVNPDGSAGAGTILNTSRPLFHPKGIRLSARGKILLVEETRPDNSLKSGRLDAVTVSGDNATITTIKDGFEISTGLTPVGDTIYVLESKFDYLQRPELKGQDAGAFIVTAVPFK